MSSISCESCGGLVELPANFCDNCGSPINVNSTAAPNSEAKQKNPGEERFRLTRALKLALGEDPTEAIKEARLALQEGLPPRDEIVARSVLGSELLKLCDPESDEVEEVMLEGINELERALSEDRARGHGFFLDPVNRAGWLTGLEPAYALHARMIHEREGIDDAIKYLEDKLRLFDYWLGVHMALLNFELGGLYREQGDFPAARKHWLRALDAEPLFPENKHELRTKEMARNNLGVLEAELGATHVIEESEEPIEPKQVSLDVSNTVAPQTGLVENEGYRPPSYQTCWTCNAEVELPASFCDMCGDPLGLVQANRANLSKSGNNGQGIIEIYGSLSEGLRVLIAVGIGLLVEALLLGTGLVTADLFGFNIFYLPLLFGVTVSVAKPGSVISRIDRLVSWLCEKRTLVAKRDGYINQYFLNPFLWGLERIITWTEKIDDEFFRCGVRVTSSLYFTAVALYLLFVVSMIILAIIFLFIVLAIIGLILSLSSDQGRTGWSERRTGFFGGSYIQHYDDGGSKAGWSEERTGFFGDKYVQHYDQSGSKEGLSEERTGLLGDEYVQHHDQGGKKTGWSEEKTGLFGDKYTEHYDQGGSKAGWSEEKTGVFGDKYIEHHGSPGTKGSKSSK